MKIRIPNLSLTSSAVTIKYFLTNKIYNFLLIELVGQEDLDARVLQLIL